jgi:hypothetical protein
MKIRLIAVLTFLALCLTANTARADDSSFWYQLQADGDVTVKLWFFWSKKCKHCQHALPVIESISREHAWLQIESRELIDHPENRVLFRDMAARLGQQALSVPAFFYCGTMLTGFDSEETTGRLLLEQLEECRHDLERGMKPVTVQQPGQREMSSVLGMDARELPLPLLTVIIAGLDAFNPCAFFILLFLLSLVIHVNNRGRMLLVGGVFVLFSGLIYFLFMAAWLNIFLLIGALHWVTIIAGVIAAGMGIINIKDAFISAGPSLSIPENAKPGLFARMRQLLNSRNLPTMLVATVILALAANSYELLCTSGLPMIYTRLLTLESLPVSTYYLYLAFYNLIYILPLLVIVVIFVKTLGSRKLQSYEGRALKLLSGMMMFLLGLVLLIKPDLLSNIAVTITIIMIAIAASIIRYRVDKAKDSGTGD